jgi:hypothetical protein
MRQGSRRSGGYECGTCGLDFGSLEAFDKHFVGTNDYLWSPERPGGRRCLTEAECELGGFVRNAFGRLTLPRSLTRGRRHSLTNPPAFDLPGCREREAA